MSEFSGSQISQDRLKTIYIVDAVERCCFTGAILVINFRRLNIPWNVPVKA